MGLTIKAHGKINLTLDVLSRRPDGYHDVEMIMQSIALHDTLRIEDQEEEIMLTAAGQPVSIDEDNLIIKAARLLQQQTGTQRGAKIHLQKEIPVAAGLAGGSTDAAATLRGLNELWQLGLSRKQLMELGVRLGADVPFCLLGGTAIARGIGEELTPLPAAPNFGVVLVKPAFGVSTAAVYRGLNVASLRQHPRTNSMVDALRFGQLSAVADELGNVLESVTLGLYPELQEIKETLTEVGCQGVLMSGSGPTIFGLTEDAAAAIKLARQLALPNCKVVATAMV
ncbi:4-(cytidine 5'-diphospho)-2-C-methyl-D-erythritol kinase [Desulforamulus aeronauticus]|uniref:4-diphosphocytidyl-2-C-methyl-D-erythritol kinase n=1 Tax=Desulforamulus aeronauticus DSM 10349 TaxID=1121421 RepID=A0A1M6RQG1_9FIRM|nr:4-(cytidine 5'-diphospho)-2-C-methyl-D-erythritol kinase [Desulforamulus aeronauticus]SHK34685.1 4-diphosphocytidyl-2-C-methyl-D-erythritol kinase [Desulforamulus aeronauticus DSM 10349]